ncbi:ATP-binding cassette domain-containing protein [Bacteroidia bacterium]|jgi:ABC-2 type transport system ATP-binding protein|nr:ATP-binding cassette domain-containing protein [Bacteroidia bacterium]MDC0561768.1 ATP-binding cassette domain-containing protein [Bacteroidia bacterium]
MSIEVQNLTKIYDGQKALDEVSFSIGGAEIVGFLGPNGAGKSTTMKILSGHIVETSGTANILGMDVSKESLEIKKRIGYLPELNPLYGDMYVREYLSFIADIHKIKDTQKAINRVIKSTGLERESRKKISQLSKGYKQRVGLAQALINDPDVLILDEPTSGLDPNQMKEIRSLILSLGKNKTILLSSHIMQEVEAMCSRVIILNKGKIIADDTIEAIKKNWDMNTIQTHVKFRDSVNGAELSLIDGVESIKSVDEKTFVIVSKGNVDIAEELFNFAIASNTIIVEQKEQEKSLESIFQKLTNHA